MLWKCAPQQVLFRTPDDFAVFRIHPKERCPSDFQSSRYQPERVHGERDSGSRWPSAVPQPACARSGPARWRRHNLVPREPASCSLPPGRSFRPFGGGCFPAPTIPFSVIAPSEVRLKIQSRQDQCRIPVVTTARPGCSRARSKLSHSHQESGAFPDPPL